MGELVRNDRGEIIGCSFHPKTDLEIYIGDDDIAIYWCRPHDGSDSHIIIGSSSAGEMRPNELKKYASTQPSPREELPDTESVVVRHNLPPRR